MVVKQELMSPALTLLREIRVLVEWLVPRLNFMNFFWVFVDVVF